MFACNFSKKESNAFEQIAEHISATERQSASAEQDALDRYVASFLENRTGEVFDVRVSSVTRFGLFVSLPIYTLLDGTYNPYLLSLWIVGVSILFFALAVFVWTRCEKYYESTGS